MTTTPAWVGGSLQLAVIATAVYAAFLFYYVFAILAIAYGESRYRRRQRDVEDYDAVLGSRYTIPVSIIAPAFNEEIMVVPAIQSLLDLSYPEFEVIVVDDGSSDGTFAALEAAFELEPRQVFFRNVLGAKNVRMVYRSRSTPRLTVVTKDNGGKADALNCGINFARYRYLCCVDGDTVFTPDALLTAMSHVMKDPARIVGAGSLFGISLEPEAARDAVRKRPRMNRQLLADFQHLDLMRSFVAYRMGWTRLNCMLCVPGAFAIWRRDVILEMGGFSPSFTCEDIEMTFRIHEKFLNEERPYRIISLPSMVAQTEGPGSIRSLISQRARWQRVTLETIWHYRGMVGRPRYKSAGLVGIPYYLFFECLAPVAQFLALVSLLVAIIFGLLDWPAYLAFVGMMIFGTAIPTSIAVLMHDTGFRDYRTGELLRMLLLGPLDLLLYRPILVYAGMRGFIEFIKREKGWNKFARNVRQAAASVVLAAALSAATAVGLGAQVQDPVATSRQLLRDGRRDAAADLLARRLASNPEDDDARVLHATVLSWSHAYGEARHELESVLSRTPKNVDALTALAYVELWSGHALRADRVAARGLAIAADNVDLLVARATTLRRLNERPAALATIERAAALAPGRADVQDLRGLLRQEVHGSEAMMTGRYDGWADDRDPFRETQAAVRQNTTAGPAVVRVSHATRFGLHDDQVELEAYPRLRGGYAALGASYAGARLYARTSFTVAVFKTLPGDVEVSGGYRRLNFSDPVNLFTGSASLYLREYLLGARLTHAAGGAAGNGVDLSGRRYFADGVQYVGARLGTGYIREDIRTESDAATRSNQAVKAEALFLVNRRWILLLNAEAGYDDAAVTGRVRRTSGTVGFGLRF